MAFPSPTLPPFINTYTAGSLAPQVNHETSASTQVRSFDRSVAHIKAHVDGPLPYPNMSGQLKQRQWDVTFSQRANGEPLTCFIMVSGMQGVSDWLDGGKFASVLQYAKYFDFLPGLDDDPDGHMETLLHVGDFEMAEMFLNTLRQLIAVYLKPARVDLRVFCITAQQYACRRDRSHGSPITMSQLPVTFRNGFDGQMLVHARLEKTKLMESGTVSSDDTDLLFCAIVNFLRDSGIDVRALSFFPNKYDAHRRSVTYVVEVIQPEQVDHLLAAFYRRGGSLVVRHLDELVCLSASTLTSGQPRCSPPPTIPSSAAPPAPPSPTADDNDDSDDDSPFPPRGHPKRYSSPPPSRKSGSSRSMPYSNDVRNWMKLDDPSSSSGYSSPTKATTTTGYTSPTKDMKIKGYRSPRKSSPLLPLAPVYKPITATGYTSPKKGAFTGFGFAHGPNSPSHHEHTNRDAAHFGNNINLHRIAMRVEHRSTVMFRNIPSDMTTDMLVSMIQTFAPGLYTFIYLRKDFKTSKNVGYGFVDFIHPDVVAFMVDCVEGHCWPNSNKKIEMSFATFQGIEALVERFRNSVVMLEPADHQPRIYAAVPAQNAGQQLAFPPSDNRMKLCRSVHSAQDVGLFNANTRRAMRVGSYDLGNPRGDLERMTAQFQALQVENYQMKKKLQTAGR